MLDIYVRPVPKHHPTHNQYVELKMTVYGTEFDFGLLDKEEAEAFAETFREAAEELDPERGLA